MPDHDTEQLNGKVGYQLSLELVRKKEKANNIGRASFPNPCALISGSKT